MKKDILEAILIIAVSVFIFLFCYALVDLQERVNEAEKSLMEFRNMNVPNFYNPGRKIPIFTDKHKDWMRFQDIAGLKYAFNCKGGKDCYGKQDVNIF